jgi:hypothetical protein
MDRRLSKPEKPLMRKSILFNGRNTVICAVIFIALMVLIQGPWIGARAVQAAAPGAAIPVMRFSYAPEGLKPMFESLGENGRAAYLTMNIVDFFFAAAYGLLYFVALGWIAGRLFPRFPALRFIGLLGVLGALADETENVVFRLIATGAVDGSISRIAAVASPLKYSCVCVSMALLFMGLAAVAIKALAGKRDTHS